MEPAVTQFESQYAKKVNFVMINVDHKQSDEMKKYGEMVSKAGGIPFTVWLDSKGTVLGEKLGGMDAKEMGQLTDGYLKKAK